MKGTNYYGRDLPLQFASAKLLMRLTRGGHCPCHNDEHPSFSAKPGREPGTTVVACGAGCTQGELLAHFRKLGFRLGPMRMAPPKRPKRPVEVATSVAFRILTRAEQTMYALIATGENPTYNDFEAAGVRRKSIAGGLRATQTVGLVGVRRSPRRKGCRQYEQNEYWTAHQWRRWEPSGATKAAMKAAINRAKAVAKAARKGGEDISEPMAKPETDKANFLVSEVALRGGVFAPESYEDERLASLSQERDRPTMFMKGESGGGGGDAMTSSMPPCSDGDDPGPMSVDDYGAVRGSRVARPPGHVCGYDCRRGCIYAGEASA